MALQSPNDTLKSSRSATETTSFIEVAGFTFRLKDVDGFHQMPGETNDQTTGTTVYFKGYTAMVRDPDGELFQFLRTNLK